MTKPRDKQIKTTFGQADVLFPIFLLKKQWDVPELNEALRVEMLELRAKDPDGIYRSNAAGTWHSDTTLFKKPTKAMAELQGMFVQAFSAMAGRHGSKPGTQLGWGLNAWGMMYADGGYATVHNHPNCHFAGVYYVAGVDDNSPEKVMATGAKIKPGTLEFVNPVQHALSSTALNLQPAGRVVPKSGLMAIFPSWLNHFVHPVSGDTMRYAIACNASVGKSTPPKE
jgi:uncharacterized protein (TIGR02466 family)